MRDFVFPMFRANAVYEGLYLLGTSIARPLISKRLVEIAEAGSVKEVNACVKRLNKAYRDTGRTTGFYPRRQPFFVERRADVLHPGHGLGDAVAQFGDARAVAVPVVQVVRTGVPGQPPGLAAAFRYDEDVVVAEAVLEEGEVPAVRADGDRTDRTHVPVKRFA